MLKALLTFLTVTLTIYLIGDKVRRNPKIDGFIGAVEWRYANLNSQLEQASIRSGLLLVRKIYGWASIALIAFSVFVMQVLPGNSKIFFIAFNLFLCMFLAWFSIKWTLEHKATLIEYAKSNALFVFMPILAGLLDTFLDASFAINVFAYPLQHAMVVLKLPAISLHPFTVGLLISCFMLVSFAILYFTTWLLITPLFIGSVIAIMIPIYFARFLAVIDRSNTFFWLVIFTWAVSTCWLTLML